MTEVFIEPFNFEKIYLQYFLGNMVIFYYVFVMVLSFACAYFNMSNKNFFILLTISSIILAVYLELPILIITLFLTGLFCYKGFRWIFG